ncbi:hypothetical protein D9757_002623 [Collybiopsis confluens]|uniref:Uncharacterized protein n=1 Tax=Collybiopsis confluens TaxID=2823264 RepID=A0A8H5ME01_9AGAR|nr:hypothetical protein D9757_002623 [Collybiopsis confluens]
MSIQEEAWIGHGLGHCQSLDRSVQGPRRAQRGNALRPYHIPSDLYFCLLVCDLMKIEWASDFHRDGSRRNRPIPSTMHGWLAKMRGTLIGNEKLRSQGIREMKEAKAVRKYRKDKKALARSSKGFSLFGSHHKSQPPQRKGSGVGSRGGGSGHGRPALRQHSSGSHRLAGHPSRRGTGHSRGSRPAGRGAGRGQRRGTVRRSSGR